MTTYHPPLPHAHPHRRLPYVAFGLLIAAVLAVVALVATSEPESKLEDRSPAVTTSGFASAGAAVSAWTSAHRGEVFPTVTGPLLGECAAVPSTAQGLCTLPREDLGDAQVVGVGVVGTDSGTDLLVLPSVDSAGRASWNVAGSASWPAPESGGYGAPWLPSTTLAEWTATDGVAVFGPGATFVAGCSAAGAIPGPDQVLLCGTLVEQAAGQRTYAVGPMGGAPVIRVQLSELGDHTWWVSETQAF